jgi:3-methyladenine DNA glycosylase/8-oxoguanine DNA glycosylase
VSVRRIHLEFTEPFAWAPLLNFFSARQIPGVEQVSGRVYSRSVGIGQKTGWIRVFPAPEKGSMILEYSDGLARVELEVVRRVRAMFDLDADPSAIAKRFKRDASLRARLRSAEGLRIPGCWDPFEIAVRAVIGQQVSVQAATTIAGRLCAALGERFEDSILFPPFHVLADADLSGTGLVRQRAETIRTLARAVCSGELAFDGTRSTEETVRALREIRGIGPWTAQYIAMRALKDPDAFPAEDLILRRSLNQDAPLSTKALLAAAEAWRPWRAYAAILLWHSYARK